MTTAKSAAPDVTRDSLEGFIWRATGWRGAPEVIDSILAQLDRYVAAQLARSASRARVSDLVDQVTDLELRVQDLEGQLATQVREKQTALDVLADNVQEIEGLTQDLQTLTAQYAQAAADLEQARQELTQEQAASAELTRRLVEQSQAAATAVAAAQVAVDAAPVAPVIERTTVSELLGHLRTVHGKATEAVDVSASVLLAVDALNDALRAADGFVKDIEHSPEAVELAAAHEARHAEALAATEEYVTEYEAQHGPIPEEAREEARRVLGIADEPEQDDRELPASLGMGEGPGDLSEREGFGEPEPEPESAPEAEAEPTPEQEPDPVLAAIAEAQAESEAAEQAAREAEAKALLAARREQAQAQRRAEVPDKECIKCHVRKPYEDFHKDRTSSDGHKGSCRDCDSRRRKAVAAAA